MGKKDNQKQDPESLKNAGNKAYSEQKFQDAVNLYTQAIEKDSTNHIFFANRANVYLDMDRHFECIADCDKAIALDASFVKSYARKAQALFQLERYEESTEMIKVGQSKETEDEELKKQFTGLEKMIEKELKHLELVPEGHPNRERAEATEEWVKKEGAAINYCKIKHFNANQSFLVAT